MSIELPPLPYPQDALMPHISPETLEYHYGKHHRTYVTKLNDLIKDSPLADKSLEHIVKNSEGPIFNNAAQVWNHTFYWNCLSPNGGGEAKGALGDAIKSSFGSFEKFKESFTQSAIGNFGSGWTWLVKKSNGEVAIVNTSNAETPIRKGEQVLLTCDVWEHAYYIDYRNARPDYLAAFWKLVNWDFATKNFN
ncbi:MAG: Fe-Mn family superoxide dismutase [Pseudomonadota bacterium]